MRYAIGTRIGLFAGWLYDHGFNNRLWFAYEGVRRIGAMILGIGDRHGNFKFD